MTTSVWTRLHNENPLAQPWLFGLAVLLAAPALLFSDSMPGWTPALALLALGLIFLLRLLAVGRLTGQPWLDGPLLLLLLLLPVGLGVSANPAESLPRTYDLIANLAIFWAVAAQRNQPWLRHSGWLLLLAGVVFGAVMLLGVRPSPNKLPFIDRDLYSLLPGGWRTFWNPAGFNPNLAGGLVALFFMPAVVLIWRGRSWQQRDVAKAVALALAVLLLLMQSRGALLGVLVALLVVTTLHSRGWWLFWLAVALGLGVVAYRLGPQTLLETSLDQAGALESKTLASRQDIWERSIYLIRDHPLTGVGLGMVQPAIEQTHPLPQERPSNEFLHAHNIYLQAGAEMGLPGLLAYLALYFGLLKLLLRRIRNRQAGFTSGLALGLLGTLIVFLTHGFFDVIIYFDRTAFVVWGLFGLMVAVATRSVGRSKKLARAG